MRCLPKRKRNANLVQITAFELIPIFNLAYVEAAKMGADFSSALAFTQSTETFTGFSTSSSSSRAAYSITREW